MLDSRRFVRVETTLKIVKGHRKPHRST